VLDSFVDTATNRLVIDHARLRALLDTQVITAESGARLLSEFFSPSAVAFGVTGGLLAVITPPITAPAAGADDHVRPATLDKYHLVATTANGLWPQVVLRGIGTALGLADEYELPGVDFAEASETSRAIANAPNVVFSEAPPLMNADIPEWLPVMSPVEALAPAVVHQHPPNDLPNTATPAAPAAEGAIIFFEGAGGFRRKAYRSAEDCLMRRAPGLGYLPARDGLVDFCPVCVSHILTAIG
jgi:hypothetical protein